jgi:Zn-dependent protease with chaperone function
MIEGFIGLASYGLGTGGDIGNALFQLEQMGVFAYLLPFLLIFALVYGILTKTTILGNNKGINVVLAIAIGLMALQFNFVSYFFAEIFPRLGVGLAILLVMTVLLGAFVDFDENSWAKRIFFGVGALTVLIIVFQSLGSSFGFGGTWFNLGFGGIGYRLQNALPWILVVGVTGFLIFKIVKSDSGNAGAGNKK